MLSWFLLIFFIGFYFDIFVIVKPLHCKTIHSEALQMNHVLWIILFRSGFHISWIIWFRSELQRWIANHLNRMSRDPRVEVTIWNDCLRIIIQIRILEHGLWIIWCGFANLLIQIRFSERVSQIIKFRSFIFLYFYFFYY